MMPKPKIARTLDDVLPLLSNVKPYAWRDYQYKADPPCHTSASRESLYVGESAAGLEMSCWACCVPGHDWREWKGRVARALGLGAIILRGRDGVKRTAAPNRPPPPPPLNAFVSAGELTVAQWRRVPAWIARSGKKTAYLNGAVFKQSKGESEGGMALARFGGPSVSMSGNPITVRPWARADEIIAELAAKGDDALALAFCPGGDEATPAACDVGVIDFDYDAETDRGDAKGWISDMRKRCRAAGLPMFSSTSGSSFHAIYRAAALPLREWKHPQVKDAGYQAEVFTPGTRRLIGIRLDAPEWDCGDALIPVLTDSDVRALVGAPIAPKQELAQERTALPRECPNAPNGLHWGYPACEHCHKQNWAADAV